ncbi:Cell division protein ZapA-like protein, partial [gut metagenome]
MDEEFLINVLIAGKKYQLAIERQQEEIVRAAAARVNAKLLQYGQHYGEELDVKDLLAMVAM